MDYFDIDFEELLEYIDESIKQNQNEEITLDEIAKQFYISKYYFHRLFHSATGEPFAKFIKRRRLLFASHEIISTDKDLIDIAYDYGFNSQDVFIRSFKQLFGYTPGYFRKLYREIIFMKRDKLKSKGVNIMFDIYLGQRLQFSDNDKRECLETVGQILECINITRRHGLLAVEDKVNSFDNFFFRKAISLAIDSWSAEDSREVLQNYIIAGGYKGKELLERILIMEGTISIINGNNAKVVCEKLAAYFGESFSPEYEKYFKLNFDNPDDNNEIVKSFNEKIKNIEYPQGTNLLEEHFKSLSDHDIQLLIKYMEPSDFVGTICGSSEFVIYTLLKNMSQRYAAMIITEYNARTIQYPIDRIIKIQNKILSLLFDLKAKGEISGK